MNKLLPVIVVCMLTLGGFGAFATYFNEKNNIVNTIINFSDPIITADNQYTTIELPEKTTFTWETDFPMLPVYTKTFTLPFGTIINLT